MTHYLLRAGSLKVHSNDFFPRKFQVLCQHPDNSPLCREDHPPSPGRRSPLLCFDHCHRQCIDTACIVVDTGVPQIP